MSLLDGIDSPRELDRKSLEVQFGKTFVDSYVQIDGEPAACYAATVHLDSRAGTIRVPEVTLVMQRRTVEVDGEDEEITVKAILDPEAATILGKMILPEDE